MDSILWEYVYKHCQALGERVNEAQQWILSIFKKAYCTYTQVGDKKQLSHLRFSNFITGRVAVLEAEIEAQLAALRATQIANLHAANQANQQQANQNQLKRDESAMVLG